MNFILTAVAIAASWSGTFSFAPPVTHGNGLPLVHGAVNLHEPGLPMYPVKTVFVPVPPGVEPVLSYTAVPAPHRSLSQPVPRAGILQGSGLDAVEVPAAPMNRSIEAVEYRGVFPLAGTQVAVIDIHPLTEAGFTGSVSLSLEWSGGGSGVPIPPGHLLGSISAGEVYWPREARRAESPFWGKPWARLATGETGVYRITCNELEAAGCEAGGVPISSMALYSGPGTQFAQEPETAHQLQPVAILVTDANNDGLFNGSDEIIFTAGALNRFEYIQRSLEWLFHRYATHRVYWLTWGGADGLRMQEVSGPPDGSPEWGDTAAHTVHMEEGGYWLPRWENDTGWFWRKVGSGENTSIPLNLGYSAGNAQAALTFAVTEPSSYEVTLAGSGTVQFSGSGRQTAVFEDVNVSGGSLNIAFSSTDPSADLYLDHVELSFPAVLSASSRRIFFNGSPGRYTFSFPGGSHAFDASDLMNPVRITGAQQASGSLVFSHTVADTTALMVAGGNSWLSPDTITPASPGRLVGTINGGDRLLVVPEAFVNDALALESMLGSMGYSVVTATVREIYDEFGQGVKDPGAIRSAVRWGMDSWSPSLSTVILCGSGHYDPLGLSTDIPDHIPPMVFLRNDISYPSWASEDWFAQVHENAIYPEIPVARIPAENSAALGAVLAKTAIYSRGNAGGSWSSRFVLFADDEWGGTGATSEWDHTFNMESICYGYMPPHAKPEKFYLIEYPWPPGTTPGGVHPEKPEARAAFLDLWNQGMAVMLFFGHGSANQLAHEKVMLGDDPASLENGSRLPLAMFMSCDVSKFFVPGVDCLGEKVVYHPGGGAVASIGATGGTYSSSNAAYARAVTTLLTQDGNSMGHAFWAGKLEASRAGNTSYYVYLGCPDLSLDLSRSPAGLTVSGDTLRSGEMNTVSGSVESPEGLALVEISESDIPWEYPMLGGGVIEYFRQGGTAWRGRAALSGGEFVSQCMIPLSSATGGLARADAASVVASGVEIGADAPLILVQGDPGSDQQGPEISMWISGQQGVEEPVITGEGILEAELTDPSGITFLGRAGSSIRLFVDNSEYDLSDAFSYNTGSTVTGRLQYAVSGLAQGSHRFILRAMDGLGNPSSDTLFVTSTDAGEVAIQQHIVYPNPGTGSRCFSFTLSAGAHVTVSVFTTAGRRIRTVSKLCEPGYNQIMWDGLDGDGDIPASGAYIYMIEAQTENGLFSMTSSVTGVLATVN